MDEAGRRRVAVRVRDRDARPSLAGRRRWVRTLEDIEQIVSRCLLDHAAAGRRSRRGARRPSSTAERLSLPRANAAKSAWSGVDRRSVAWHSRLGRTGGSCLPELDNARSGKSCHEKFRRGAARPARRRQSSNNPAASSRNRISTRDFASSTALTLIPNPLATIAAD